MAEEEFHRVNYPALKGGACNSPVQAGGLSEATQSGRLTRDSQTGLYHFGDPSTQHYTACVPCIGKRLMVFYRARRLSCSNQEDCTFSESKPLPASRCLSSEESIAWTMASILTITLVEKQNLLPLQGKRLSSPS